MELSVVVFHLLAALTVLIQTGNHASAQSGRQNITDEEIVRDINDFIRNKLLSTLPGDFTPALSVSVVKDGKMLMSDAYGTSGPRSSGKVNAKTKFLIGSLTKAFTALMVVKWLQDRTDKIRLDTPIQSYRPEFRLADDLRSSQTTLKDLLAHRVGIPSYDKPLMFGAFANMTMKDMAKRLETVETRMAFRDRFEYNNYMYPLASHVVEQDTGRGWQDLVEEWFLDPLGMTDTGFLEYDLDYTDFAKPFALVDGEVVELSKEAGEVVVGPLGPAGKMYSTADDMAKWMKFIMSGGLGPQNVTVVKPYVVHAAVQPAMLSTLPFPDFSKPSKPFSHVQRGYALGWITGNYRGYDQVFHSGSISSFVARLWMFPERQNGIYVNINGPAENTRNIHLCLMYYITDKLMGLEPWFEDLKGCSLVLDPSSIDNSDERKTATTSKPSTTQPTTPPDIKSLKEYVGNYTHSCFGTIELTLEEKGSGVLMFKYGSLGLIRFKRLSTDVFVGKLFGTFEYLGVNEYLLFGRDSDQVVDKIYYALDFSKPGKIKFQKHMPKPTVAKNKKVENSSGKLVSPMATLAALVIMTFAVSVDVRFY